MTSKATQWAAAIAAWQRSGSSQSRFCREHRLSLSSFGYYWRRRLAHSATATRPGALVPVVVSGPAVIAAAEVCVPTACAYAYRWVVIRRPSVRWCVRWRHAERDHVLVPPNTWHTVRTEVATTMLFLTPGAGTEHRPVVADAARRNGT
jgi:hypothetical protein